MAYEMQTPTTGDGDMDAEGSRPLVHDLHHQDSVFANTFQSRSFFVVHPEWLSESVDNQDSEPLSRPPWSWEQPRYRHNIQLRMAREEPAETRKVEFPAQICQQQMQEPEVKTKDDPLCHVPCRPMPYTTTEQHQPYMYMFTHPSTDITKPQEKQTRFGVPIMPIASLVDPNSSKLSY